MLKLNTLLTGFAVILLGVLGYMGTQALAKLDATNSAQLQISVKLDSIKSQVDDHETRIRLAEKDVTILQQDVRIVRSPRMSDNNKP